MTTLTAARRTPIGRFLGAFAAMPAPELGAAAARAALEASGVDSDRVDEVIFGHARAAGVGPNPARQVAHRAGLPDRVPAFTVNKACGSGLKALLLGAQSIRLGEARVVLVGGMENMSRVPYLLDSARTGYRMGHGTLVDAMVQDGFADPLSGLLMGETAEKLARRDGLDRAAQDAFALESQRRAAAAWSAGRFTAEVVPVVARDAAGRQTTIEGRGRERMAKERNFRLRFGIPAAGILLIGGKKLRIGAQHAGKSAHEARAAAHPAKADAFPGGDGIAGGHHLFDVVAGFEETMGVAGRAGIRCAG